MEFKFNTISNFDKHISDSIRGYKLLDNIILNICSFFAKKGEKIIDLGCTTGRLISILAESYPESKCIGYDILDSNFKQKTKAELIKQDITDELFNIPESSIILSVFTLQFIKHSYRMNVIDKIYNSLTNTGVFIICEKEISNIGIFQEAFTMSNYDFKKHNFTPEEILEKEKGLRSVMNCLHFGSNEIMLKEVGFSKVEPFFQSLNFRGWICMK
jgi:tRNA (cmo5U34)-methyltransferase